MVIHYIVHYETVILWESRRPTPRDRNGLGSHAEFFQLSLLLVMVPNKLPIPSYQHVPTLRESTQCTQLNGRIFYFSGGHPLNFKTSPGCGI